MKTLKKKKTHQMVTFRVRWSEFEAMKRALAHHPQGWKGLSHFARELMVDWAAATLARAEKERAA